MLHLMNCHLSLQVPQRGALFGDTENGFILAGMSLTHLTKIQSAKEIVEELVSETERRLAAAPGLIWFLSNIYRKV